MFYGVYSFYQEYDEDDIFSSGPPSPDSVDDPDFAFDDAWDSDTEIEEVNRSSVS